jgi:hypothetical protein
MRTTLEIDDDLLAAARDMARAEGRTMGEVISDLVRRGLTTPSADTLGGGLAAGTYGDGSLQGGFGEAQMPFIIDDWPTFPDRPGPTVTPSLIAEIQDDLDFEDAMAFDHATGKPIG